MPYAKKALDGRTKAGRSIRDMKKLIRSDLDAAAVKILQNDIASLSVVSRLCLDKALGDPNKAVDAKGNLHLAMSNYLKIQTALKQALVALRKFEPQKPGGLAGLFEDDE